MICPYNRKSEKCVKRYNNDLINEETGIIKGSVEAYTVGFNLMSCAKEECGAWHNGRCNYNQGVND